MLRCSVFFMVQLSQPPDSILVEADGTCPCVVDNVDLYWGQASQATQGTLAWGNKVTTERDRACPTCARNSEKHTDPCGGRPRWTLQAEEARCGCQPAGGAEPAVAGESAWRWGPCPVTRAQQRDKTRIVRVPGRWGNCLKSRGHKSDFLQPDTS